jgi:hypothetical protein
MKRQELSREYELEAASLAAVYFFAGESRTQHEGTLGLKLRSGAKRSLNAPEP